MPDRKPEPWQSGAVGPFLRIEGSLVVVWALGEDRLSVRAPGQEQVVTELDEAERGAEPLAERLD